MIKKFYWQCKLAYYAKMHTNVAKILKQIEDLMWWPCDLPIPIAGFKNMHPDIYEMYVNYSEISYEYAVEEASLMLKLGLYDRYKEQCKLIKAMNDEIMRLKSA